MASLDVLGLVGPLQCGKSTVAGILTGSYGYERIRMAGILKDMLRCTGLDEAQIDGDEKEIPCELLGGKTPRWAMQTLGTEWGRDLIHPDLWVILTENKIRLALEKYQPVVIDDIRFPNEIDMIRRLGGSVFRVQRASAETAPPHHLSEKAWRKLPVDGIICNEFDILNLKLQVQQLFDLFIEERSWTQ